MVVSSVTVVVVVAAVVVSSCWTTEVSGIVTVLMIVDAGEPITVLVELTDDVDLNVVVEDTTVLRIMVVVGVGILRHEQAVESCLAGYGLTLSGVGIGACRAANS